MQALRPSSVSGTLMQILSAILERTSASFIISAYSVAATSAETGPSTMSQISLVTSAMLRPDFRISDGLVVTPSSRPRSLSSRISLTSAVSTKNFMAMSPWQILRPGEAHVLFGLCSRRKVGARSRVMKRRFARTWLAKPAAIVPVLVPMPAERPYTYAVPDGMAVVPGSIVRVPLGPREVAGIVWDGPGEAVDAQKLQADHACLRLPAARRGDAPLRRLDRGLHAVAARHGGAHDPARARSLRSGAVDRGPAAHRAGARPDDDARAARAGNGVAMAWPGRARAWRMRPASRPPSSTG